MQEPIVVTVICSCYNHQEFVGKSILSVLNQTYKNIQLIVVDDCSTDDSVAVITPFIEANPAIVFIQNKTNLGLTKSVNNAMNYAKGTYFIDLSADDLLLPNCIEIQLETLKNSALKNIAIVYGNAELITKEGKHSSYYFEVNASLKTKKTRPSGNIYSKVISAETTICSVTALYSKAVFDSLGGYDATLSYEDLDYWIRASRSYTIVFVDAILVQKRITPNSLQTTLYTKKNTNSYSTLAILQKAYRLNRNKAEHLSLSKRVNFEIKNSLKTRNYGLLLQNIKLRLQILWKTI